jgi:hypothetical protein
MAMLAGGVDDEVFDVLLDSNNLLDICKNVYVAAPMFARGEIVTEHSLCLQKRKRCSRQGFALQIPLTYDADDSTFLQYSFGMRNSEKSIPLEIFVGHNKHIPLPQNNLTVTCAETKRTQGSRTEDFKQVLEPPIHHRQASSSSRPQ